MSQEINVHAEIPIADLVRRITSNPALMNALANAIRTTLLQQARSSGDAFGGFAGTNTRDLQNLKSPVFAGHWNSSGVWVRN